MSNVDPETGIWSIEIAKRRHVCDYTLAGAIGTLYTPDYVADVGCGSGMYCRVFSAYGWSVDGYEGTPNVMSLGIYDNIVEVDLTQQFDCGKVYDLVVCLEVGEHIPKKYEGVFLDNVCRFASDKIVLSWAVPGQYSASGHVNNRSNSYVIRSMESRGFRLSKKATKFLRYYSSKKYFRNTVMAFYA